jgi:hypothetical protein
MNHEYLKGGSRMRKIVIAAIIMGVTIMVVHVPYKAQLIAKETPQQFEVLSPWPDVDPIPLRGISPRLDTLKSKKIGLFANFKRAAKPITDEIEKQLKAKYPDAQFSLFHNTLPNVTETETVNKEKFAAWAKGVDAVIGAVGD